MIKKIAMLEKIFPKHMNMLYNITLENEWVIRRVIING